MAIEAGCHVLIEKPVALGMAHADKLVELASKHDVRVLMGFHMRWHRLIRRWREYVHSGANRSAPYGTAHVPTVVFPIGSAAAQTTSRNMKGFAGKWLNSAIQKNRP